MLGLSKSTGKARPDYISFRLGAVPPLPMFASHEPVSLARQGRRQIMSIANIRAFAGMLTCAGSVPATLVLPSCIRDIARLSGRPGMVDVELRT